MTSSTVAPARDAYAIALDEIDLVDPMLFHRNEHWAYFKRLREEDPVHYTPRSRYGPFWSITRYQDILAVNNNHRAFSSLGVINLDQNIMKGQTDDAIPVGGFLALDPPAHDERRKTVTPAVAPRNLVRLEGMIRERTRGVLAELPIGAEFDWVEAVSLKLTMLMLATLLDFPPDQQPRLKRWSDIITGSPGDGNVESWEQRDSELAEMGQAFLDLREQRRHQDPAPDIISMLAHSAAAADMTPIEYISDISLLIVGGNDTTRNTMSGSIVAFDQHPAEWTKLMADPKLLDGAVPEMIRWQTPVLYQGRRAMQDQEIGGKTIRKGDMVAMWYISGNRDETAIVDPDRFIIDRERPRQHLSFGFGIHRCLGNRLAEMQLRVLWEEIIEMGWKRIEVVSPPIYAISNLLRAIEQLPVRIHA